MSCARAASSTLTFVKWSESVGAFVPGTAAERVRSAGACRGTHSLEDAVAEMPSARVCLARELTKKFEEYKRGTPAELLEHFKAHEPRGEFCVVIAPSES